MSEIKEVQTDEKVSTVDVKKRYGAVINKLNDLAKKSEKKGKENQDYDELRGFQGVYKGEHFGRAS